MTDGSDGSGSPNLVCHYIALRQALAPSRLHYRTQLNYKIPLIVMVQGLQNLIQLQIPPPLQ